MVVVVFGLLSLLPPPRRACGEPAFALRPAAVSQQHPGELLPSAGGAQANTHLSEQHLGAAVRGQR